MKLTVEHKLNAEQEKLIEEKFAYADKMVRDIEELALAAVENMKKTALYSAAGAAVIGFVAGFAVGRMSKKETDNA